MLGRRLLSENDYIDPRYMPSRPDMVRRRAVLAETLSRFVSAEPHEKYHLLAQSNLERWFENRQPEIESRCVRVFKGDWGDVTLGMTREYGECFGVLNMANAFVPGGAYVEGAPAQEENMFRRTDCHFHVGPDEYDSDLDLYHPHITSLLSAEDGRVYLDVHHPRVCIRGAEDRSLADLGYDWLPEEQIFPFYELRSAAMDLRDGSQFSESSARQRIAAQLETLMENNVKHVVLGASGCGAFMNPAESIAEIYRQEIENRREKFSVIAFAIHAAGYGPDNFTPFERVFGTEYSLS